MATQLSKLFASEISRLQKVEWVEKYILARAKSITASNIQGGWRGAGLFPLNRHRVLRTISDSATPPPPLREDSMPITPYLISSSPPDAITLRTTNEAFNKVIRDSMLSSPVRNHGRRLSGIAEYFQADNAVLRKENGELKEFLNKRTERQSGKRVILKGKFMITTEQIYKDLADAEQKTKKKLSKRKQKKSRSVSEEEELELLEVFDVVEDKEREIQDCIAVQQS